MGNYTIKSISFEEGFMPSDKEDLEMLSDMIVAATHQAQEEIVKFTEEKMQNIKHCLVDLVLKNFYNIRKRNERDKVFRKTY